MGDKEKGFSLRFRYFTIFLLCVLLTGTATAQAASEDFKAWLKDLRAEAISDGISRPVVYSALPDTMEPIEHVLKLDRAQPEGTTTYDGYIRKTVTSDRVEKGRAKMLGYNTLLNNVQKYYGVDKQFIVALWGIETSYGNNMGGYDVVTALATLAYDGRRGDYFRGELFKALKILDEGHIRQSGMKGSWAGAMGQSQFMPSSFFKFAVDFDKDGRRDIWNSEADVFASAANYLSLSGWKLGAPWGRRVKVPLTLDSRYMGVDNNYSLQFWHDKGVRLMTGQSVPFEGEYMASIIQPGGPGTTAYLVYDNYKTILKWNKSSYFATAVCVLADSIRR